MKKRILLLLLFVSGALLAQDSLKVASKSNPIIFYDTYVGVGGAESAGWIIGGTVNYQFFKRDLITARVGGYLGFNTELVLIAPVVGIPVFRRTETIVDYGVLYGKRWITGGTSFSVSAGVSYMHHEYLEKIGEDNYQKEENLIGIPFEFNIKFFKSQKRRLRLYYGIIPVTKKPVAFGRSIGFKFVGNISKANYGGLGISYGFGTHKKY